MIARKLSSRSLLAAVGLLIAVVLLAGNHAGATPSCKPVVGRISLEAVEGPDCLSGIGLCSALTVSGGKLKGDGQFVGSSQVPTADTPSTGIILITGDTLLETDDGSLALKDALLLRTTGAGEFSNLATIIGGTERWAGASGILRISGTLVDGSGSAVFTGSVCTP